MEPDEEEFKNYGEFEPEILMLISNNKKLPVPLECAALDAAIRSSANKEIISEIPIPPGIQRLVIEKLEVSRQIAVLESLKMGYSSPALKLRKKNDAFAFAFRIWVGAMLEQTPLLVQSLGCENFSCNVGDHWTLLFVREHT